LPRWTIQLIGEPFDVEEYVANFPVGSAFVFQRDGQRFLTGEAFEAFQDARDVQEYAEQLVDLWHAALTLRQPNLYRPKLGGISREYEDGRKSAFVGVKGVTVRSKVGPVAVLVNGVPHSGPTAARRSLDAADRSAHLRRAMLLWSASHRSWPRLFTILEEVETHLGRSVVDAAYADETGRERFKRTANSAESAGLDARHASGKFAPAPNPMKLDEGTEFVRTILRRALEDG
jgi:hypothetical protein